MKLMRRLSNNLCSGLCASSACRWEKLQVGGLASDVCVMSRVGLNEPGEPAGVVLSASTSVWMPVSRQHLFDILRDEKLRGQWDILANNGPMEVIARLSKSHDGNNCVSLLCPPVSLIFFYIFYDLLHISYFIRASLHCFYTEELQF